MRLINFGTKSPRALICRVSRTRCKRASHPRAYKLSKKRTLRNNVRRTCRADMSWHDRCKNNKTRAARRPEAFRRAFTNCGQFNRETMDGCLLARGDKKRDRYYTDGFSPRARAIIFYRPSERSRWIVYSGFPRALALNETTYRIASFVHPRRVELWFKAAAEKLRRFGVEAAPSAREMWLHRFSWKSGWIFRQANFSAFLSEIHDDRWRITLCAYKLYNRENRHIYPIRKEQHFYSRRVAKQTYIELPKNKSWFIKPQKSLFDPSTPRRSLQLLSLSAYTNSSHS